MLCNRRYRTGRGSWVSSLIMLAVAGFLVERGAELPAAILAIVAIARLIDFGRNPERALYRQIVDDAGAQAVVIPNDVVVWTSLYRLYALYRRTSRTYAQLVPQYADIIANMWQALRTTHDLREWRRIVSAVAAEWPAPYGSGEDALKESLAKAKAAARKWQEAHREAHHWT